MNIDPNKLPSHVAIIMDGNRRWAKEKGLPIVAGHRKVVQERIEELIEAAGQLGIEYITFWAWSSENWKRPGAEVSGIMKLFRWALKNKAEKMIQKGARLKVIGDISLFEPDIRAGIEEMMAKSKDNRKITVTFGLNYGGRDEILRAIQRLNSQIQDSQIKIEDLDQQKFSNFLDTAGMPDPDLIIRPGREQRLSGFMLWQAEYAELVFPDVCMPDFGKDEFIKVIEWFGGRERRYGGNACR